MDPLADFYANQTPYQYGNNDPIYYSDPTGLSGRGAGSDALQAFWNRHKDSGSGGFVEPDFGSWFESSFYGTYGYHHMGATYEQVAGKGRRKKKRGPGIDYTGKNNRKRYKTRGKIRLSGANYGRISFGNQYSSSGSRVAVAGSNGSGGSVYTDSETSGKDYLKEYTDDLLGVEISQEEFDKAFEHPIKSLLYRQNFINNIKRAFVFSTVTGLEGEEGGRRDAFRHALISALNGQLLGSKLAIEFGVAHEDGNFSTNQNRVMDLINNSIGASVGAANPNATPKQIVHLLLKIMGKGAFVVIENGNIVHTTISEAEIFYAIKNLTNFDQNGDFKGN